MGVKDPGRHALVAVPGVPNTVTMDLLEEVEKVHMSEHSLWSLQVSCPSLRFLLLISTDYWYSFGDLHLT
jgi:hypothetical protein